MSAHLSFVTPPFGLEPVVDFVLDEITGAAGLYSLHAAEDAATRLFVVDAGLHLPDYSPEISEEQAARSASPTPTTPSCWSWRTRPSRARPSTSWRRSWCTRAPALRRS